MSVWQTDDVIVEAESSLSASEGEDGEEAGDSENDIRQLKARRHALANKLAQQQKRRDKIQVRPAPQTELIITIHIRKYIALSITLHVTA